MAIDDDMSEVVIRRRRLRRLRGLIFDLAAGNHAAIEPFETPDRDDFATIERAFVAFAADFAKARRRTRELEAEKAAVIAQQAEMIRTLTAPVIEVADGVVAVPIVGALDSARAQSMTSQVLARIMSLRTTTVLVDLSGASEVGPDSLRDLGKLVQAIRLLGAECIVTGIRPEIATTIVGLGVGLGVRTARSLGEGLRLCSARAK